MAASCEPRRARRPCHPGAISSGHQRYPAVSHGHAETAVALGAGPLTWIIDTARHCMACKRSRLVSALLCPAGRSAPGRVGPERRRRPRPDGTGPSVRAGSVAHRDRRGTSGHQGSPAAKRTRRSAGRQLRQLAQRQQSNQIVVPKAPGGILGGPPQMRSSRTPAPDQEPLALVAGQPRPAALIGLGPANALRSISAETRTVRDRGDRRPLRHARPMLEQWPDGPLPQLGGYLSSHGSNLS
jgi:hypothetical protein